MRRLLLAALVAASMLGCGRRAPRDTIVKGQTEVQHVQIDSDHVYWRGHNAIVRANKDGSDQKSLVAAEVSHFVVDRQAVYFTSEAAGIVESVALAGGVKTTLATKLGRPGRLAQDFVFLYVCNHDGSVVKIAKAGGGAQPLGEKQSDPQALAVDDNDVFFGTNNGQLFKVSKAGGKSVRLDADTTEITDVAVDDAAVYWVSQFAPTIKLLKIGKAGGTRTELARFEGASPRMIIGGALAFVSAEIDGRLKTFKIPLAGGELKEIGAPRGLSGGLASDAQNVFLGVADPKGDDGWIVKLSR